MLLLVGNSISRLI